MSMPKKIEAPHHDPKTVANASDFHPLHKVKGGYVVVAKSTGKPLESHPISKAKAEAQLRAVEMSKHGGQ